MRICLVSHGFPPVERTGVENYTAGLAAAFARAGHTVDVFAPRPAPREPEFSVRRELREGFAVDWITVNRHPSGPREMLERPSIAAGFGLFLDRERPEVVHFQHVLKLGVGLIRQARERGIPTLYTAHDYYPVCHRYTLLRPDLRHCDVRGDSMACGRCDLALGYLNRIQSLGDYQMGVLPEQLDEEQRGALAGILDDDPAAAGLTAHEVDAACDRRRELDAIRAEAFGGLDRIIAPTRFLADELIRGGIESEKIEVLGYGIENWDLEGVPAVRPDPSRPLRFGFFGGISKQKGVHVLIEAFRRAEVDAELTIWGGSTDERYAEDMRAAAETAGVRWMGSFERGELPRLMAEIDVVGVPSIWVENQPLVIREAFSARRPVVTSRLGALSESVRDEVDGLLVEPGDPDALADALRRLCAEPGLVTRMAAAIGPVVDADRQAAELVERYEDLRRSHREARAAAELPATLQAFVRRYDELAGLPGRQLFRRALHGLERLREVFAEEIGKVEPVQLLLGGLVEGSRVQSLMRDMRLEVEWLHEKEENLEQGRAEVARALQEIRRSFARLGRLQTGERDAEETLEERERHVAEMEVELRRTVALGDMAQRTQQRLLAAELRPLLRRMAELTCDDIATVELPGTDAALPELMTAFRGRLEALQGMRRELDWRRDLVTKLDEETTWRHQRMQSLEGERARLGREIEEQEQRVQRERDRLAAVQHEATRLHRRAEEGEVELAALRAEQAALQAKVGDLHERVAESTSELEELRAERARLQKEKQTLQKRKEESASRVSQLQARNAALKAEKSALEGERTTLQGEVQRLETQAEASSAERAKLRNEKVALRGELERLEEEKAQKSAELETVRGEKAALRGELQRVEEERRQALAAIAETRGEVRTLSGSVERLEGRVTELRAGLAKLRTELRWRRDQMSEVRRSLRDGWVGGLLRRTRTGRGIEGWVHEEEIEA